MQYAQAEPVTEQQARERAAAFLHQNHQRRAARAVAGTVVNDEPALAYSEPQGRLFVYNASDKATGFVIIAGSSLLDNPVLGYTESGAFDSNNLPCNFEWWLESTAKYISALESGLITPPVLNAPSMASRSDVSNFLKSTWNQTSPYNDKCPTGCVTGCVATALAQVLYYYKQPSATTKAIPEWTDANGHSYSSIPSGTPLNLSSCTDTYTSSSSTTAKNAVANLMQICGQAVYMKWGSESSSGEFQAANALHQYFGYSHFIRDYPYDTSIFTQEQWIDLIYAEIAAKRPVMFAGVTGSSGHVFLCSGYQKSSDKFWINWGWGGSNDGWFSLFLFNPGGRNYSGSNSAVIGIKPADSTTPDFPLLSEVYGAISTAATDEYNKTITRSSSSSSFTSNEDLYVGACLTEVYSTYGSINFDLAMGIYKQDGTLVEIFGIKNNFASYTGPNREDGSISYSWYHVPFTVSSSVPAGTYNVFPVCRKNGTSKWYRMFMSSWPNRSLKLVISGNTATVSNNPYVGPENYEGGGSSTPETDTTAPTFSGSISTSSITSSSVALSWSKASDNVTAQANLLYQVQYKKSSASSWTTAKSYTANITSFTVTGLSASTTYNFRVTVKDEAGNTTYKDVNATTEAASTTVDYGINIAGTQLTSSLLKPGYGYVIDGYMIGVGGSIDAFLNTAGDEVTIYLDNIYCSSTAMMPLLTCDGNGADRIKKIVLNVKGNNYFETSDYQAVTVKDANLRIQGTGTLKLTSPYDAIWIATGGKCEIGDEVKLKCSGSVGGNGYGEHNETLVIGEHAYVEVNNGWVQRLAAITLNDNIALIYPGLSKAMVGNQWDGSYTNMGVGVVKTLYIPSVNGYQSTGEVYGDGTIVFGENYDVAIKNTRVNAYNASDVLGDGKVTYDPFNHELTLKNVNITMDGVVYMGYDYCSTAIINSWGDEDFALHFEGENTLNVNAYNNDFPVLYATNPRVMIYGHSAKLNCSAKKGTDPFGVVFKAAKSLEFWDGEVTTISGSSAVEGTTSNAILVVAGGSKLDMKSSWGQGTVNVSTGETTFDAAVMLQNVSQLQLMDYRVIVNPKGGYFKASLGSITVDGTTPYKGEVLIGDESLGIESIENTPLTVDRYYTLDGRVMQGAPTQKGIYIVNGKKVVIK